MQSEDNYFIINPVKITLNNPDIVIHNPYVNANAIRWEDYVSRMEAYLKKQLKKLKAISEAGDEGAVSFEGIEDLGIGVLSFKK
ncbi:MAG: hypothetical protein HC913_09975 [Microscillaceae bacterium]|nr:hypothetical protein [Microscillaceae bacterium]